MADVQREEIQPEQERPRASKPRFGALIAELVYQAVRDGRWYVDEQGIAHPVESIDLDAAATSVVQLSAVTLPVTES